MNYLDIFLLVVIILGGVKGYVKGLIVETFSFIAFFVGLFLSIELTIPISNAFFSGASYFQVATIGVFVALFLTIIIGTNLLAKMIKKVIDLTFLGFLDNILGSIAAIFKWMFIISILIWVFGSVGVLLPNSLTGDSFGYKFVESIGPKVFGWLAEILPFIKDMIDSLENIGDNKIPSYTFNESFVSLNK